MVQLQASLYLSSTQMTLLEGPSYYTNPGDNGERLRAKVTRKVVEVIRKADGERVQNISYILDLDNGKVKMEKIISYSQLMDHLEAANKDNETSDDSEHSLATRGPSSQETLIGKDASTMSLLIGRLGRRPMNLSQI